MKLVWKLTIPHVFVVLIIGFFGFVTINSSFVTIREQYVHDIVESRFQFIKDAVETATQKAVSESSFFVNLPVVREAYEIALSGDIDDPYSPESQTAREMLRRELATMLDGYAQGTGARLQLHFHLPNGFSLVRLWRDRQTRVDGVWVDISDDLRDYRPTVVDVNTTGNPAMGIEPGSGGFAIRGVIPITAPDGRHLGSTEVLQDFNPIIELAAEEENFFISLYANMELLEFSVELQNPERYPPLGNFVRVVESKDGTVESLLNPEILNLGKYGTYFEDHGTMTLATLPLIDYQENQVGVIICAMNTRNINTISMVASIVLAVMLMGIVIAPTLSDLIQVRLLVTRPLNKINSIIQDITEDRADLSEQVPSHQKDEIGDLARSFNTFTGKLDGILKERQEMLTQIQTIKEQTEAELTAQLAQERDIIQTMKDSIEQGIFLMDRDFKILSQYSKPLISILSYYDSELEGKNFLDILAASLDTKQLQTMKGFFKMIFDKSKRAAVLEAANPISEFEYKIEDRHKILSTKFNLIEKPNSEPMIIGIIQDITKEKEFERELQAQSEAKELEMKNMFDVVQIDPVVFQDFIEDTEANFNYINSILKDRSLTQKQIVTKIFQNVHAIKSNSLILGLEVFGNKLHELEDDIKRVSAKKEIAVDDILDLAFKLETIMQEKDSYTNIIKRLESYKTSNQLESVLVTSLKKAMERTSLETNKKVLLTAENLDEEILESKLRKPIRDILFQCTRNSVYHSIETPEERIRKNKKPQGELVLTIKKTDGKAVVTFSDDGRGLDWGKIREKYLKLHPGAKDLSNKVLLSAIFTPEFSTSEETTTSAGRGVGLSLVKDLVKENGGAISVNSTDAGLTMKFTFPMPAA